MKFTSALLLLLIAATPALSRCGVPTLSNPAAVPDVGGQSVTIRWKTSVPADALVAYGLAEAGILAPIADVTGTTEHSVTVGGLLPGRRYAWAIRSRAVDRGSPCDYRFYSFYGGAGGNTYFVTRSAPAGSPDYYIRAVGPQHVTQGHALYYEIEAGRLTGSIRANAVTIVLSGLPPGSSVSWTDKQILGSAGTVSTTTVENDTFTFYDLRDTEIRIAASSETPPGSYDVKITAGGSELPTHMATWPITVDSVNAPFGIAFPHEKPTLYAPIPALNRYKEAAATYGAFNCAQDLNSGPRTIRPNNNSNLTPVGGAVQKGSWYYDGLRVYYNIGDLLSNNPTWEQCRTNIKQIYRDRYVISNKGAVPAYVAFSEGYYIDYLRTSDPADLTLIDDLDLHTFKPVDGSMVSVRYLQRETAYALKVDTFASVLRRNNVRYGRGTNFWMNYHLDHVLGHVDQICLSRNAEYWESFMGGLEADALITYYENISPDPRIPSAIKCLADYMYANAYNAISDDLGAFQYDNFRGATNVGIANAHASSMIPLNLLIAPMYAWLFKETGEKQYQVEGDLIWKSGVLLDGAGGGLPSNIGESNGPPSGNSGKLFSQQYYWSTKYVTWRSAPVTATSSASR
jgi:hypothetical protein